MTHLYYIIDFKKSQDRKQESEDITMSKGKWDVSSQYINDKKIFTVYRLRDTSEIDHSGNREYKGGCFDSEQEAQALADKLNKEEQQ